MIKVDKFLKKHNFVKKTIVDEILFDMETAGERKKNGEKGGQDMFRTWMLPPEKKIENEKVIVIDAGGTNFRSCLVTFLQNGKYEISEFKRCSMPAIEKEYSKEEFFCAVADRIEYLKNKASKIGFCFSYAMDITKEHDGIPNAFSKEIKAKEVLGVPVGKSLVEELDRRGWNKIEKITLLNDTVSALLSGVSLQNKKYSSYIGFILGTGMNAAFIDEDNLLKDGRQIIVCESGKCKTVPLSDFDLSMDKKTEVPKQYPLEKCCSGAYLGMVGLEMLLFAAKENLFSLQTKEKLKTLKEISTVEINNFLLNFKSKSKSKCPDKLNDFFVSKKDRKTAFLLFDSLVERCALYASSILASNLIFCGRGKTRKNPVCIVLNGTTLFKTYKLKERLEKSLRKFAAKNKIYFEFVTVKNDITLGTAIASMI